MLTISQALQCSGQDADTDLSNHLARGYNKKVLILRNFYKGERLEYDGAGHLTNQGKPGFWTTDGIVRVQKLRLRGQHLLIEANRLLVVINKANEFEYKIGDERVAIGIELDQQHMAPEDVDTLFSKVFLNRNDRLEEQVPDYWKRCLFAATTIPSGKGEFCRFSGKFLALSGVHFEQRPPQAEVEMPDGEPVEQLTKSITPPKTLYAIDPEYSEAGRQNRVQGKTIVRLVVNSSGQPGDIAIVQPLGYGLDEQAIAALLTWKFSPAQKDGKPVAVWIDVEFTFMLG